MSPFLKIRKSTESAGSEDYSKSGSKGTTTLIATADEYTGRSSRVNKVTAVSDDDATKTATATITQLGSYILYFKESGSTEESGTVVASNDDSDTVTYTTTIVSNAPSLQFEVQSNDCVVKITGAHPTTGVEFTKEFNETTDVTFPTAYGVDEQYELTVEVTVPANTDANTVGYEIVITDPNSSNANPKMLTLSITQAQSTPTISLTPLSSTIAATGGTVNLTLTTNDDWTATVTES